MKYTVQLDFYIEEDVIRTEKSLEDVIKETIDYGGCAASNVKLINVSDDD